MVSDPFHGSMTLSIRSISCFFYLQAKTSSQKEYNKRVAFIYWLLLTDLLNKHFKDGNLRVQIYTLNTQKEIER